MDDRIQQWGDAVVESSGQWNYNGGFIPKELRDEGCKERYDHPHCPKQHLADLVRSAEPSLELFRQGLANRVKKIKLKGCFPVRSNEPYSQSYALHFWYGVLREDYT